MLSFSSVKVLDAADPVARRVRQLLDESGGLPASSDLPVEIDCATTGDPQALALTIERLREAGAKLPALVLATKPFPLEGVAA